MTNPLDQVIAAIGTNITSDPKQFQFNTTFTGDLLVYQGKLYTVDVGGGTSSSGLAPTQWHMIVVQRIPYTVMMIR